MRGPRAGPLAFRLTWFCAAGQSGRPSHRLHRKRAKAAESPFISCSGRQRTRPFVLEFTSHLKLNPLRLVAISERLKNAIALCADSVDVWRKEALQKRRRAHRTKRACTHPVKEPAINKDHTIYVHFLSTAVWKHITWRRDPSTLSCHSTLSMRQRSQIYKGGDAVPGRP